MANGMMARTSAGSRRDGRFVAKPHGGAYTERVAAGGTSMRHLLAVCVALSIAGPVAAEDYPHVFLKSNSLKLKVYLPDGEKGFYRGTRFVNTGVAGEVEFAGHKLFGPWKDKHDPTNHDDIIGFAPEFGQQMPLGYDDAKVGGTFLKIGVGELEKPAEEKYSFATKYKVVKRAEWKELIRQGDADNLYRIGWLTQGELPNGLKYVYELTYQVTESKGVPTLHVTHQLKNVGRGRIVTDFYQHNFFNVDADPIGPNYSLEFIYEPKPQNPRGKFEDLVTVMGKELRFKDKLDDGYVMAGVTGYNPSLIVHRQVTMKHATSGVRVQCSWDPPTQKINVWGVKTTICPEPFTQVVLEPRNAKIWHVQYRFEQDAKK
jgi:hypothetical protein